MDRLTKGPRRRAVVCHANRLVAEDLRQLLVSLGAHDVAVFNHISEARVGLDAVAFVEGAATDIAAMAPVQAWLRVETPVVAMNGRSAVAPTPKGIHALEQPFRSEDVIALLQGLYAL